MARGRFKEIVFNFSTQNRHFKRHVFTSESDHFEQLSFAYVFGELDVIKKMDCIKVKKQKTLLNVCLHGESFSNFRALCTKFERKNIPTLTFFQC